MFGCADGHWILGVAHHSRDLPPTLVRNLVDSHASMTFDSEGVTSPLPPSQPYIGTALMKTSSTHTVAPKSFPSNFFGVTRSCNAVPLW